MKEIFEEIKPIRSWEFNPEANVRVITAANTVRLIKAMAHAKDVHRVAIHRAGEARDNKKKYKKYILLASKAITFVNNFEDTINAWQQHG